MLGNFAGRCRGSFKVWTLASQGTAIEAYPLRPKLRCKSVGRLRLGANVGHGDYLPSRRNVCTTVKHAALHTKNCVQIRKRAVTLTQRGPWTLRYKPKVATSESGNRSTTGAQFKLSAFQRSAPRYSRSSLTITSKVA